MSSLNNKKTINAWAMYDWANSVYSLVITSTIFPIYFNGATKSAFHGDMVSFFGFHVKNTQLYSYSISFSFLVIAFLSPILSGIADYSGNKKSYMRFFATLGSFSCIALMGFYGNNIEYGILFSVLASIGFAGSLVFYNAYLPEIVTPDRYDNVSAKGYALGYIGSVLLMIVNLIMTLKPGWFGFTNDAQASRYAFLTVGLWWLGFSQITFAGLPKGVRKGIGEKNIIYKGYRELIKVWQQLSSQPMVKRFLLAYFFYNMAVQTVMYLAATFGSAQLKLPTDVLITSILVIQVVAIGGAYLFALVSKKMGNIFSLSIMICIWMAVCVSAYFVNGALQFQALAFVVGLIMGGIQSLSRSTYSKLLPETDDHASYFSFYDVMEKTGIVLGTFIFGYTEYLTGNMRNSVWPLLAFFIIGFIILQTAKSSKLKAA